MNAEKTVLLIEDEPAIVMGLTDALGFEGYRVVSAATGRAGVETARVERPDLVILDLMLPDINGFEVCRELRRLSKTLPIVMLSARSQDTDKIRGLDVGADDYVTKPFSLGELIARIRAAIRRGGRSADVSEPTVIGRATVNLAAQTVTVDSVEEPLTTYEVEVLRLLLERKGEVVSRDDLLERVWGGAAINSRAVDNFIVKLRRRVERNGDRPQHILTVWGRGYKLVL